MAELPEVSRGHITFFGHVQKKEGPNKRRFPEIEGHEGVCREQTTSKRRLPAGGTSGTQR